MPKTTSVGSAVNEDMKIDVLSAASGVKPRSIRKYIGLGIVAPPSGRTRGATYSSAHLADLLTVRKLLLQGMTLAEVKSEISRPGIHSKLAAGETINVKAMSVFKIVGGVVLMFDNTEFSTRMQELIVGDLAAACAKRRGIRSDDSVG